MESCTNANSARRVCGYSVEGSKSYSLCHNYYSLFY